MHRVLFILCVGLTLSTSVFSRPRGGYFRPHFFSPDTEEILFDVPLFLHFQELAHRLNRLSWELRREAFHEGRRQAYQHTLDELVAARDELVTWMRQQNLAAQEIAKLEQANVENIDTGPLASDGAETSYDESAPNAVETNPPLRIESAPSQNVSFSHPAKGRLLDKIPEAVMTTPPRSDKREQAAAAAEAVRFRGDPIETMGKFGSLFSATFRTRAPRTFAVPMTQSEGAGITATAPQYGSRDISTEHRSAIAETPLTDREEDLNIESPTLAMSGSEGGFPSLRQARHVLNHLVDSNLTMERGGWALIALVIAILAAIPLLYRRPAMESIDLSSMPPRRQDIPRMSRGSNFSVVWDTRIHCWTLTQRLDHTPVPRVVAELREGSVVYGNLLGRSSADRYRLNDIDEWIPTQEPERLVLDLREGLRFRGVS